MSCTSTTASNSNSTLFENAFYIAINLQDILYGIELALYFKTMHILLVRRRELQKSDMFYAVFSSVILFLITIWVSTQAIFGQKMWLLDRSYPGGPSEYAQAHTSDAYMVFGATAVLILQLMTDGLMVYRCRIVCGSLRTIIIPSFLWLVTLALGVLVTWTSSAPGMGFFKGTAAKLGLAYYSVSVFLNVTLTCMICYSLVCHVKTVRDYLGEEHVSPYFSIIALLVESILPYTLSGIAFLVSYGIGSQTESAFSCVYTLMMCVSPQILILRMAEGHARQCDTNKPPPSLMVFSWGGGGTSECLDEGGGVGIHSETLPKSGEDDKV